MDVAEGRGPAVHGGGHDLAVHPEGLRQLVLIAPGAVRAADGQQPPHMGGGSR